MPAAGASISAPAFAVTSIPSCGRARCRIGWTRMDAKALEIHPLVGMMDGVAANRSRCLASEPYASFSDRTRMSARRLSASMSTRAASAARPFGPTADRLSRSDHAPAGRSEEHTSELQSQSNLVCRLLLEKKKKNDKTNTARRRTNSVDTHQQITSPRD